MYEKHFVGYEYQERLVKKKYEPIYLDAYPNFGWFIEKYSESKQNPGKIILYMKRNRDMINHAEIKRLENKFEASMSKIIKIEDHTKLGPTIQACLIGILGTAAMAGAVCANNSGQLYFMILLGLIGFMGWALPYLFYKQQYQKKIEKKQPLIESEYDVIYDLTKRAHALSYLA
ncbi:hypothetical protein JK162_10190 [Leuconostoc pseudomesenteroides]|uniref:hypothetical protein n=1 Tax=Leuconostoc pseudomesenteroides TaxID=33968 RepID=UPI001B8B1CE9|nr:hypothetical protein [Leuconostoc pseudomesenteroides]MBS0958836.1 hypothetical protein [Leuconostoc pseudomesenteroides]